MRTWPTGIHSVMTKTAARGYEHRVCELCGKSVRVGQLYRPMRHKVCGGESDHDSQAGEARETVRLP